jgi:hypothetical protein
MYSAYPAVFVAGCAQTDIPDWGSTFTGPVDVIPTCTYLGEYSLSLGACSNKVFLSYSDTGGVVVGEGDGTGWFLSAVTVAGTPQETGTILAAPGSSPETASLATVQDETGTVRLQVGSGTLLIPVAANPEEAVRSIKHLARLSPSLALSLILLTRSFRQNILGFCPQLRLKDPKTGLYLSVDDCGNNSTLSFAAESNPSTIWNAKALSEFELTSNHVYDDKVTSMLTDSDITFYSQAPVVVGTNVYNQTLPEGFVRLGLNENGTIISFVCPQIGFISATAEVQIGQVGGRVDPATGAAYLVLDDVFWRIWGTIPDTNLTLTKEEGLLVTLGNVTGGTELTLTSVDSKAAPENTIFTVFVPATTQSPPEGTSLKDRKIIEELSMALTFIRPGSNVSWAFYLEAPEDVQGAEYLEFAAAADQGVGPGGTHSHSSNSTGGQSDLQTGEGGPTTSSLQVMTMGGLSLSVCCLAVLILI